MAEYQRLDELCHINMGQSPDSTSYNQVGEGIPFFQGNADFGTIHPVTRVWCNAPTKIVETGTLLISVRAPIGALNFATEQSCIGRGLAGITPKNDINLKYIYYCLKSKTNELNAKGTGSTFKAIAKKALGETSVKVVPSADQAKIVEILDKTCSVIEARKQQLAELDNLIKARFVEMFGNPVSNEMRWEQVPLSACVESIDNGKSFVCDSAARQGDWPAVLKLSAATYGFYRPEENKAMLDDKQFVEDAAVRVGDLLFTRKNTPELVGMCAYVYDTPRKLMMPDLIFRLNTTPNCNKLFLWKLINHDFFRECIQAIATGSAKSMSNISKERLLGLKIILPPIGLQEQFAAFVEQTDKSKVVEAIHKTNTLFNTTLNGGNRYDIRANEYKTK